MTQKQRIEQLERYLSVQVEANKMLEDENQNLKNELASLEPKKYIADEVEKFFNSNLGQAVKDYIVTFMNSEIDAKLETFEDYLGERDYLREIGEDA